MIICAEERSDRRFGQLRRRCILKQQEGKKTKKRIMIFAHYYPPDLASTGQLLKDLAEGMLGAFDVTVICTVPSYSGSIVKRYKGKRYHFEKRDGVKVIRVRVPEFTKSDKHSRIRNITAYFFGALGAARRAGEQDYVFTISQPPILGGLLGVIGKWQKSAKMIYCIQDFNPEQIMAVGYCRNALLLKALMVLDKFSCRHSDLVVTVGRDLVQTLEGRFRGKKVPKHVMINNWIDEEKIYPLEPDDERVCAFRRRYGLESRFVFMYSGNIGLYYGLKELIKIIEQFEPGTKAADGREVAFAFVGDGALRDELVRYTKEHHMDNVVFIPYQEKEELVYSLNAADVHWVVNAEGMKGVSCPSKFYGIAAVGKPMIGVLEEGAEVCALIKEAGCGVVCEPGDNGQVREAIRWSIQQVGPERLKKMGQEGHSYLMEDLTRNMSVHKYIEAIGGL